MEATNIVCEVQIKKCIFSTIFLSPPMLIFAHNRSNKRKTLFFYYYFIYYSDMYVHHLCLQENKCVNTRPSQALLVTLTSQLSDIYSISQENNTGYVSICDQVLPIIP